MVESLSVRCRVPTFLWLVERAQCAWVLLLLARQNGEKAGFAVSLSREKMGRSVRGSSVWVFGRKQKWGLDPFTCCKCPESWSISGESSRVKLRVNQWATRVQLKFESSSLVKRLLHNFCTNSAALSQWQDKVKSSNLYRHPPPSPPPFCVCLRQIDRLLTVAE